MTQTRKSAKNRLDYKEPSFTATNIELEFTLADHCTQVKSKTRYKRLTSDKKMPLVLDGEQLELKSVLVNGLKCEYREENNKLIIENVPDDFYVQIENIISPAENSALMGLYKSSGVFCTQCEPKGFRRITYFLDRPDVLAVYRVKIIGPEYGCGVLLSNGNLVEKGIKGSRHYAIWEDPFPKPSYLFALVAGSFDVIEDVFVTKSQRKVNLALYVDRGAYDRGLWAMQCIKQAMKWDEDRFDLEYDLDIFNVVAVDFFNYGAMENKSLNIFNSIYVLVDPKSATDRAYFNVQSVIGHEYFHNYTGDRVTLRDWFQLALKEGLTVFRDQEFSSDVASRALTRLNAIEVIRSAQFAEDSSPTAHPVRPDKVLEMNNFYTVTVYDKGAEIIRMMHTMLGEEKFQKAIKHYLTKYDGKAVTIEDFVSAIEESSLYDLAQFRRWYSQSGTPKLTASWQYNKENSTFELSFEQHTEPTLDGSLKEPFVIPIRTSFLNSQGQVQKSSSMPEDGVLILKEAKQTFVLKDLSEDTLPVILEDFSAPVKLKAPYTTDDYRLMLKYASCPFIKQDSAISLVTKYVHDNIDKAAINTQALEKPQALIEAYEYILTDNSIEQLFIPELVKIPSLASLIETFDKVDFDALVNIRNYIKEQVALSLYDKFKNIYEKTMQKGAYVYSIKDSAQRSLNNMALDYISLALIKMQKEDEASNLVLNQYNKANNMTLKLGAMTCAVHNNLKCKDHILKQFYDQWHNDALVLDNYFRIQATAPGEDTIEIIKDLIKHPKFDITNPNRVRALVGAMSLSNPQVLHNKDGSGYNLLTNMVIELDPINSQVGARILTPLVSFKRFDDNRQNIIKDCLRRIIEVKNLSNGVYEKVRAALEQE